MVYWKQRIHNAREDLDPLILGDDLKVTGGALFLAGTIMSIVVALDYAWSLSVMYETPPAWLRSLHSIYTLQSPLGILLVFFLSVIYTHHNRGYLPTLLLGASMKLGDAFVYFAEFPGLGNWHPEPSDYSIAFGVDPYFLTGYTYLKILIPVTVAFLLGIWLRGELSIPREN